MRALLIAAPASGSGKTTVTLALLAALRRRGLNVAPFKVGPDFIDPGHHAVAAGRESRNLDPWMCGAAGVRRSFAAGSTGAELALVEGVMGLFDGASGGSDAGSSAEVARLLGIPVLLVVDAAGQARSVAALVQGFAAFDPQLQVAGVILNRVASPRHAQLLSEALASVPGLPPLVGCLSREPQVELPSRHLGLVTAADAGYDAGYFQTLADWVEAGIELPRLLALAGAPSPQEGEDRCGEREDGIGFSPSPCVGEGRGEGAKVKIAVARDAAFCFCYGENLELLQAAGAELAFFSPLADRGLPEGCAGLYLPGGYPELHGAELAGNLPLLAALRAFAAAGRPIYAECGGLLYLSQGVGENDLLGLLPGRGVLLSRRKALGYRQVTFTAPTILGPAGTVARGHEFHYSELALPASIPRAYRLARADGAELDPEGYAVGNLLGSYVHLHFASNPVLAANFVAACRQAGG